MYCSECGQELSPDKKFCTSCGTPVQQQQLPSSVQQQRSLNEIKSNDRRFMFEKVVFWSIGIVVVGIIVFFGYALFEGNRMVSKQKAREANYPVQPKNSVKACDDMMNMPSKGEYANMVELTEVKSSHDGSVNINNISYLKYIYKAKIKNKSDHPIVAAIHVVYIQEGYVPVDDTQIRMCLSDIYIPANETRTVEGYTPLKKIPDIRKAWIKAMPFSQYSKMKQSNSTD